jgi:hypothetical protein
MTSLYPSLYAYVLTAACVITNQTELKSDFIKLVPFQGYVKQNKTKQNKKWKRK